MDLYNECRFWTSESEIEEVINDIQRAPFYWREENSGQWKHLQNIERKELVNRALSTLDGFE
jgi:hypothetical protein|tara:strand:+ start:495 stop:680 length:186 start_codon:yes stop_codon:yes gene_type:complete